MKIAVTAQRMSLDARVDPRFGRCAAFLIMDSETGEIVGGGPNEFASASGGAGPKAAQWVIEEGVDAVVTGNIGSNALRVLEAANVRCVTGATGNVRRALAKITREASAPRKNPR